MDSDLLDSTEDELYDMLSAAKRLASVEGAPRDVILRQNGIEDELDRRGLPRYRMTGVLISCRFDDYVDPNDMTDVGEESQDSGDWPA